MNNTILEKMHGCFMGCIVGDAFGAGREFSKRSREDEPKIRTMQPIRHFGGLPAGSWTDDTSMMLCLAESIIEYGCFDHRTSMNYYLRWLNNGHNSVTGRAFDIGNTCQRAIIEYKMKGYLPARTIEEYFQSNGCLMRLAPIPIFYSYDLEEAVRVSGESALTTHAHPVCKRTTELYGWLLASAIRGQQNKEELLHFVGAPQWLLEGYEPTIGCPDLTSILPIITGDYLKKSYRELDNTGYVVGGLATAMWIFANTSTFQDGLISIVHLGGDSDTLGAIYGMLAGAYYGFDSIPADWLEALQGKAIYEPIWCRFKDFIIEQYAIVDL